MISRRTCRGCRCLGFGALVLMLVARVAAAQPPAPVPPPMFAVHSVSGAGPQGPLTRLAKDWSVGVGDQHCSGADLLTLRRVGVPLPSHPQGPQVILANGDRVPMDPEGPLLLADNRLHFRPRPPLSAGDDDLAPPVNGVALVWFHAPQGTEDPGLLLRRLLTRRRVRDLILLDNGDFLEGRIDALDARKKLCRVVVAKQLREVPFANLAALVLENPPTPAPRKSPFAQFVLLNGTRVSMSNATLDAAAKTVQGQTLFGAHVQVPTESLVALEMRQGKAVYLSDLEASHYEHTPFLGVSWPHVKDGSVAGRELRLKTGTHDKGIGMHARSSLTYDLGGRYRVFEALVGLDAQTGKSGRVRLRVLLDGKAQALGLGKEWTWGDGALAIRLDVRKARTLTLVVDYGRLGDVQTHVNWADARLLSEPET